MKKISIDYSMLPKDKSTVKASKMVGKSLTEMKALDIQLFNVKDISSVADVMIIASGSSNRHVKSIANDIAEEAKNAGTPPLGVEGDDSCEWVLVDLGDVVVHIMQTQTRSFYELEKLWVKLDSNSEAGDVKK